MGRIKRDGGGRGGLTDFTPTLRTARNFSPTTKPEKLTLDLSLTLIP